MEEAWLLRLSSPENIGSVRANVLLSPRAEAVPDAPFKTTWPELAFKRALRWAAENGFDKVAWTTGEQQAARYDLSRHLKSIDWTYVPERNTYDIGGKLQSTGNFERFAQDVPPENLADYVGKDAAEKILNHETEEDMGEYKKGSLSGIDLKVGGKGMRGFYDDMLPKMVQQNSRRSGEVRLKIQRLSPPMGYRLELYKYAGPHLSYDEMKAQRIKLNSGDYSVDYRRRSDAVMSRFRSGSTFEESMAREGSQGLAKAIGGEMVRIDNTSPVHSLEITLLCAKASCMDSLFLLSEGKTFIDKGKTLDPKAMKNKLSQAPMSLKSVKKTMRLKKT